MRRTASAVLTALLYAATFQSQAQLALAKTNVTTADYTGPYRPQIHFSPPTNFMNDPNGLFLDANGTYHLYYQYNPTELVAGNQHWGHATSLDLYHWTNQPIAISPPSDDVQIFSGSAVVDVNNTSGFFPNQTNGVVAIYTLNTPTKQVQEISYSTDGGYTFTAYSGNPVIDSNSTQFRDPKVFWYAPTEKWVMVVAYAQEFAIGFYTSPDLKAWTHASNFTNAGLLGLQYECPNLVPVPVRDPTTLSPVAGFDDTYLLLISINPGAPLGGSATQYFPGTFNGTHFVAADAAMRLLDFAKDNYAGQFFSGIPAGQDALFVPWASNWQYTQSVPTAKEGWRSSMGLPRDIFLARNARAGGWDLYARPHAALAPVLGASLSSTKTNATANVANTTLHVDFSHVTSNALFFRANVSTATAGTLRFNFSSAATGERVSGGVAGGDVWLDRGRTHAFENPFFSDKFSASTLPRADGSWAIEGVFDRSMLEVFVNDGAYVGTMTFFATEPLTRFVLSTEGLPEGATASVEVYALESTWAKNSTAKGS